MTHQEKISLKIRIKEKPEFSSTFYSGDKIIVPQQWPA